jgi:predicted RecB family nuclease
MLENCFKTNLARELKERFPGCMVVHLDPNEIQGIPDLLILYGDRWAALEGKKSKDAPHRPNQDYYIQLMNHMSFAAVIYPENKEEVLYELQQTFES